VADPQHSSQPPGSPRVNPVVAQLGAYSWRLIAIGIVGWGLLWLVTRLWMLLLAVAVAALLSRALDLPARLLRRTPVPPALVAATVLLGFILLLSGIMAVLVPAIANEFEDLGPTIEDAVDSVEDWLVEDSPFDISRQDIQDFRDELSDTATDLVQTQSGAVVSGTILVVEVFTGIVLALIGTFFILKDGERFARWVHGHFPDDRREVTGRMAARAWRTLGGYLRGSAILGVVEGFTIGLTVQLVGGSLAIPVAVITFFAAFLPFVGAVVAGIVAVLVTLVTAGFTQAVIVAVVALLVQQFDNDLLAPIVFGRNLELHPLIVLVSITAGGTLFGLFGAFLAVPVSAVIINVIAEARNDADNGDGDDQDPLMIDHRVRDADDRPSD
jgi:putative heme transporter